MPTLRYARGTHFYEPRLCAPFQPELGHRLLDFWPGLL